MGCCWVFFVTVTCSLEYFFLQQQLAELRRIKRKSQLLMCNTKQKKKGQILKSYIYVQLLSINWIKKKLRDFTGRNDVSLTISPLTKKKLLTESVSKPLWKVLHC